LAQDQLVVPEADPGPVDPAHQLEAELEYPHQRIAEHEREQGNERQDVKIRRQPGMMLHRLVVSLVGRLNRDPSPLVGEG
jgi:hypothetical protein